MTSKSLKDIYNLSTYKGSYGIEVEIEGRDLPSIIKDWFVTHDGSLRGESFEYVLNCHKTIGQLDKLIEDFKYNFKGSRINDSVRAGVHVHINVQKLTPIQIINFLTLYYIVEDVLTEWCGESRVGNLFCLRAKDAEYILDVLSQSITSKDFRILNNDSIRYSAMNLKPLTSYGSVEFRAMRTPTNLSLVGEWVRMLYKLKETSLKFNDPTDIISEFSTNISVDFIKLVFPTSYKKLIVEGIDDMLFNGMRNAQDIAYSIDWKGYEHHPSSRKKKNPAHFQINEEGAREWINRLDTVTRTIPAGEIRIEGNIPEQPYRINNGAHPNNKYVPNSHPRYRELIRTTPEVGSQRQIMIFVLHQEWGTDFMDENGQIFTNRNENRIVDR